MMENSKSKRERSVCDHVFVFVWVINTSLVALVHSLITFVAAIHAHLASIWTHVALHALHSRLAGAQTRHLFTVVPDGACGVTVTSCHGQVEERRKRRIDEMKK